VTDTSSHDYSGGLFYQDVSGALLPSYTKEIIISDTNLVAPYSNNEYLNLNVVANLAFSASIIVEVFQRVPPTYSWTDCDGVERIEERLITETEDDESVLCGSIEEPEPCITPKQKRKLTTDIEAFTGGCVDLTIYYEAKVITTSNSPTSSFYNFWIDTGAEKIQLEFYPPSGGLPTFKVTDIANTQSIVADNLLTTVAHYTTQLTALSAPTGTAYEIGAYTDGTWTTPRTPYDFIGVIIRFQENQGICPCTCGETDCIDPLIVIDWVNNCGETVRTNIEGQIKGGKYYIEGDSFKTYTGEEIRPVTNTRDEYTLVVRQYSDETFKAIAYLIANNLHITIGGVDYLIPPLTIEPSWDFLNAYGSIQIPIVEKNSIKTIKRNCCG
jgi:hypothetical protein